MLKRNAGFVHIVGLFIIIVVAVGGYFLWDEFFSDVEDDADNTSKSSIAADCSDGLYDSHTHLDDDQIPSDLAEVMEQNDVKCAVIFTQMNEDMYEEDSDRVNESLGEAPSVFVPFFDVIRDTSTSISTEYLQKIYDDFDGKLKGFGEFALYRQELQGTDLTSEPWKTLYSFSAVQDLFVMIHISMSPEDKAGLEAALIAYPNTKFLIHGFEHGGTEFARLLTTYPNLYFTLDTATLLKEPEMGKHPMYPNTNGSVDQFVSEFDEIKTSQLQYAIDEWTQVITAASDRVMWGTDASFDWHAEPEVYDRLISFTKEFISSLPEEVQDAYAYQNAVRLFGNTAYSY